MFGLLPDCLAGLLFCFFGFCLLFAQKALPRSKPAPFSLANQADRASSLRFRPTRPCGADHPATFKFGETRLTRRKQDDPGETRSALRTSRRQIDPIGIHTTGKPSKCIEIIVDDFLSFLKCSASIFSASRPDRAPVAPDAIVLSVRDKHQPLVDTRTRSAFSLASARFENSF